MYTIILSQVADYASLIGLLLTIYVAWSLRKIKNTYIFRVGAPEFVRVLTRHASTLIACGNDFENSKQEIDVELATSDVTLRSMHRRMRGESKKAVKQLRDLIREYNEVPGDKEKFYLIYTEMQRVIEEVKEPAPLENAFHNTSIQNNAINHFGRQRRAKAQQRFCLVCGFNFQGGVCSGRCLFKPNALWLGDGVRDVIFRGLAQIDRYRFTISNCGGDADALERQVARFLLRANVRREDFQRRQPILMLPTKDVEEIFPFLARNLFCRHAL
jgi:hypothetical protein